MAQSGSFGMQEAASSTDSVTKGGRVKRAGCVGRLMLLAECSPQFHPPSVPNDWDCGKEGSVESEGMKQKEESAYWGS